MPIHVDLMSTSETNCSPFPNTYGPALVKFVEKAVFHKFDVDNVACYCSWCPQPAHNANDDTALKGMYLHLHLRFRLPLCK